MATDVDALITDILRFASLLKLVARPDPKASIDFEECAAKIRANLTKQIMQEERVALFNMLHYTGNNSIFDRYVVKDGEINTELSQEYLKLAGRLRRYGNPRRIGLNPYRRKWNLP